jgi:hypothetical protein
VIAVVFCLKKHQNKKYLFFKIYFHINILKMIKNKKNINKKKKKYFFLNTSRNKHSRNSLTAAALPVPGSADIIWWSRTLV